MTHKRHWIYDLFFLLVLLLAGYLRLTGVQWGEGQHQHPDELFLTGVLDSLRAQTCEDPAYYADICPQGQKRFLTLSEYFDTARSPLNPYNRGYNFFVYGNLPLTLARFALDWAGTEVPSKFFARQLSALADLLTIFVLYLLVSKTYGKPTALLASAFSALAVMQIQQSHFFTADLFVNFFMFLAIYFAVLIVNAPPLAADLPSPISNGKLQAAKYALFLLRHPLFWFSAAFGFALGMAMASKINAAALALMLPAAFAIRYWTMDGGRGTTDKRQKANYWTLVVFFLFAGGIATLLSFRVFQPYAFNGLGFNPQWLANIAEQRAQANGAADLPWNLQWARRTRLYSFTNLTVWGLGLPLGILAWVGFLAMGWRILKGEKQHLLLWGWTAFYFAWQSLQFNPTMRYQLPIYPLLATTAAWAVASFKFDVSNYKLKVAGYALRVFGAIVLGLTAFWAFAFHSIYLRDEPRIAASRWIFQNVPAPINLRIETESGTIYNQPLSFPPGGIIQPGLPYETNFIPKREGLLKEIRFGYAANESVAGAPVVLTVSSEGQTARAVATVDSALAKDPRGVPVSFVFEKPLPLSAEKAYALKIETPEGGALSLSGAGIANETDYDWSLPFRVDGYDPFGGMYSGDLNLQVYWDDNPDKLARFVEILSKADYIVIPTNHQYAQITRLPERYPLTTEYYRQLLGCPLGEDIIRCYRVAQPGMYRGGLGFDLVQVFQSYPTLFGISINDQSAEEAFTFYDHPKVLIFKKTENFSVGRAEMILSRVDLTRVVHLTPKEAANYQPPKDLLLPPQRLQAQRAGGTWSELFSYDWLQNKYPLLGLALWYLFLFALGLAAYPLTRLALNGLKQYSYPLSRAAGLLLLAWISWMGGSVGVPFTRSSIGAAATLIALTGLTVGWARREQLREEWNSNRRFFALTEILFLVFFLIDLLIRVGNPDMWHPAKGGERPMDFSYFNAVLKSESFPPYDPWYAGGYINYYYYGFVLAGAPVKLLGIVPSIAYNFLLPTWFALVAVGAFAVAWNLTDRTKAEKKELLLYDFRAVAGIAASMLTVLLGNLGTVRTILLAFQRVAAPGGIVPPDAGWLERLGWILQGMFMSFGGGGLPLARGDWYWLPSRVIPAPGDVEPITEFPLFTFLYSDLHAHLLATPVTLFIVAWAVSFIKSQARMTRGEWLASFGFAALAIGTLRPTNTWDLYTYYPLAAIALVYTLFRRFDWEALLRLVPARETLKEYEWLTRAALSLLAAYLLYQFASLLYFPFDYWYSLGYGKIQEWFGSHTPLSSYLAHWGLFLFIITAWLIWETREWMAVTPVSRLNKLRGYVPLIEMTLAAGLAALAYFIAKGATVGLLALPLAAWAGALLLRPDTPDVKRFVLLMIGTALILTLAVELVVLVGDIGRMNTVFKLYLQAWMLFAVSAAAAFGWLLNVVPFWTAKWRNVYQGGLYLLLFGAFLFTLTASADKIADRMNPEAPRTLDSMNFMKTAQLWDGDMMNLDEDYRAIRWMQENVKGSPVIVEAKCTEYRWCTRFTIYTGLPGVVGWNWHQRQQRGHVSFDVEQRVNEVGVFYTTTDIDWAREFLKKYQVEYIVVGQLERNVYPPVEGIDGLAKFPQFEGAAWQAVYRDGRTTIYKALP